MAGFWQARFDALEDLLKGWISDESSHARNALRRRRTRTASSAGEGLARPHAAAPARSVADEERLRTRRGPRVQFQRGLGRGRLQGADDRAAPHAVYTWAAYGLDSVVTWTLTPTPAGTLLRMEQAGFRADQEQAYRGAQHGWARFIESLEQVLARPDEHTEARS